VVSSESDEPLEDDDADGDADDDADADRDADAEGVGEAAGEVLGPAVVHARVASLTAAPAACSAADTAAVSFATCARRATTVPDPALSLGCGDEEGDRTDDEGDRVDGDELGDGVSSTADSDCVDASLAAAFSSVSRSAFAFANCASASSTAASRADVSRTASRSPAFTESPTDTATSCTVPATGKATLRWFARRTAPVRSSVCSTSARPT